MPGPEPHTNSWERERHRPQPATADQAASGLSNPPSPDPGIPLSGGISSRSPRLSHSAPALLSLGVALAVLLVYLATGAPGAWWGDGQELACAAWTLGIPHPTGYPLYMLTGHAAMKLLRWLDPGRALTIYSALLLAGAIALLIPLFRRIIGEEREAASSAPTCACGMADLLPAVGAGLLVAFANTVWDHATFSEVYPLTFCIGALILKIAWVSPADRPGPGRAAALGVVFGLGMLNHYSILALAPLVALCILRWTLRASAKGWRLPFAALAGFLAMLPGYLYLPLRAAVNPPLNWGDPSNWARFKNHLTGGQFKEIFVQATPETIQAGLARWVHWWGSQWLPDHWMKASPGIPFPVIYSSLSWIGLAAGILVLAGVIFGLVRLTLRRWEMGLGLLGALTATACYGAFYLIADIDAYFMIALPAALIGGAIALGRLFRRLKPANTSLLLRFLRALPALAAMAIMLANYGAMNKSWDEGPQVYGSTLLDALPPNALIVTAMRDDDAIYTLWYQQIVLGKRPDVTVFGSGFIFQGWYGRYFEHPSRPRIPIFTEERPLRQSNEVIYYSRLFKHVLLPNLAQGRPVYILYEDPVITDYLSPKPVRRLLPPEYLRYCAYPYHMLTHFVLYQAQPNPGLAALDEAQLSQELARYFQSDAQSIPLGGQGLGFRSTGKR